MGAKVQHEAVSFRSCLCRLCSRHHLMVFWSRIKASYRHCVAQVCQMQSLNHNIKYELPEQAL